MAQDGLLIGQVAARSGVSRKALRLYEAAGILLPPCRTNAGYRVYGQDSLALLVFVTQARRLGFRLEEIKRIATLKRSGQAPCTHVLD
ncbi:MAG: MerR family transcriptional regulator, partial [Candidatus Methylomirabilis sp.]